MCTSMSYAPGLIVFCLVLFCACRRSLEGSLSIIKLVNLLITFGSLNPYLGNH